MKKIFKLLSFLLFFVCGFVSFSEASQFFAYNKQMSKNTDIPDFAVSGTTFYTDIVDIDKSNFTGKVRFLVLSTNNCSPGSIYIKDNSSNSLSYSRYSMTYINYGALCASPEIDLTDLFSLKFFYGTTQNITNASYIQFVIVDSDSFDNSVKPLSTGFSATVSSSVCPNHLIDVQYNNGNTSTIICDGINYVSINGLSTLTNSNINYEYTPYMNINYIDEDNQKLIESYDKSILYLDNGQFKKTYTGNNDWILTVQLGNSNNSFSGYLPIFDITGGTEEISTSGNIFNNFAENSVKFTLSNIPSYIQYVIIIMLLLFILGFIRKFKRR